MSILQVFEHSDLYACHPVFADLSSWRRWLVYVRSLYGDKLDAEELEIFRHQRPSRAAFSCPFRKRFATELFSGSRGIRKPLRNSVSRKGLFWHAQQGSNLQPPVP